MIGNGQKDFCADVAFSFGNLCFDDRMKSFEDQEESDEKAFDNRIESFKDELIKSIDDMMESFKEELKKQLRTQ